MPRKKSPTLTEAELKLMKVIWKLTEATVNAVIEALPENDRPAYNTVLTTMRILEDKGQLRRVKKGRAHVYIPVVSQIQAQGKALQHMVSNFFNNSPELLLLSVLKNDSMSKEELERLKQMVTDFEQDK